MKTIGLARADFEACIRHARRERVVVTRNGKPVALIVGVEGLNREQLELGSNVRFWKLITQRRAQRTITRETLERKLNTSG